MNEGWLADIRITREDGLLGDATGQTIRPTGIRDSRLQPTTHATFSKVDPWGHRRGGQGLFWSHTVTLVREFAFDAYADFTLETLSSDQATTATAGDYTTTTRRNKSTPSAPATFQLWLKTSDGRTYLARGATPTKVEWFVQGARAIIEETEFVVLQLSETETDPEVSPSIAHRVTPSAYARHALVAGLAAWPDPAADATATFSTQLIFQRELEPVQFGIDGQPTRYESKTAWELIGKTQGELDVAEIDLKQGGPARLWWKITNPSDAEEWITVTAPSAWAKLSTQPMVTKGMVDQFFDWIATSTGAGPFFTEIRRRD